MAEHSAGRKVLVIHGPNLNMLGKREPEIYGHQTLDEINTRLKSKAGSLGVQIETFQSNLEGDIVEKIQQAPGEFHGILINPAAYTHTSIVIRDAISLLDIPVVEMHLSNIYQRESFRHTSMMSAVVRAQISGFGPHGYLLALEGLVEMV
jgi:3-dehydroquinate dehydratase-2